MPLSRRGGREAETNVIGLARAQLQVAGTVLLDLTDTNPTRHGLLDPAVLEAVAQAASRAGLYEPDPRGPLTARTALAERFGGEPGDYWLTASTSEAYSWLFTLLADPGQHVAVPAPGYPLVEPLAALSALETRHYPLHYLYPYGWSYDTAQLAAVCADGPAALVVVNPGNPTGAYLDDQARAAVTELCQARRLPLIADEVFGPFHLDAKRPRPLAGESSCLTFGLDGLSKLLAAPQLKLGWIRLSGPPGEVEAVRRPLDAIADAFLSVNGPVAQALPELLDLADGCVARLRVRLAQNLSTVRSVLGAAPFRVRRVDGGWTALVDVPRVMDDDALVLILLRRHALAVHPGWLYDLATPGTLALSLLPEPDVFAAGCARLRDALTGLAG